MKICWDNLEELRYSKKTGKWYKGKGNTTYIYKESCEKCGESYLSRNFKGNFCSKVCANLGSNNPLYGKCLSEEHKRKISKSNKGEKSFWYGKHHTKETKEKLSKIGKKKIGKKNNRWDGGYNSKNIPKYDTYAYQIEWCEEVRRNKKDLNILEVKCFKCNKWYVPTIRNVYSRIYILNGNSKGEGHLYCSDECKNSCSIYHKSAKTLMKEDAIRAGRLSWLELNREIQPELRKLVLERDKNQCVKCGNEENLHCHHIYPVSIEPLLSADIDNCVTLCYNCHKEAHQKDGCSYGQLKMEICL